MQYCLMKAWCFAVWSAAAAGGAAVAAAGWGREGVLDWGCAGADDDGARGAVADCGREDVVPPCAHNAVAPTQTRAALVKTFPNLFRVTKIIGPFPY